MTEHVIPASEVPEGEARGFELDGRQICVANLGGGRFRAVSDICSHAEAFLHEGEVDVDDATVECPRHGSRFDLETGRAVTLPATLPVACYETTTNGNDILIEVN